MSGYLERIVAGAKAPNPAIRPLVRPLFVAPRNQPFAEIVQEETTPASGPPPARGAGREAAPRANPRAAGWFEVPAESTPAARQVASGNFADADADRAHPDFPRMMTVAQNAGRIQSEDHLAGTTADSSPDSAADSADGVAKQSVVGITPVRQVSEPLHEAAFQPLMPAAPMARLGFAPPPPAPAPPPMDEIQIHIGRIEIHAVPPAPPPRAPAGRPRTAVGLDDYLRRGRGRTQ